MIKFQINTMGASNNKLVSLPGSVTRVRGDAMCMREAKNNDREVVKDLEQCEG